MAITAASLKVLLGVDDAGLDTGLKRAESRVQGFASKLSGIGSALSVGVTAPLALLGGQAVKTFVDFERTVNLIQQTSGASADQMTALGKQFKELGADAKLPGTSAKDAAEAFLELNKAGLSVEKSQAALRDTLQLSAAAQVSNARAAEIVSGALNAFGLSGNRAAHVTDLLANAANAASGDIDEFAQGMQQASGAFRLAGLSLDDLALGMTQLARNNIRGSDAGTALKNTIVRLSTNTKEGTAMMKRFGLSLFDAQNNVKPLRKFVDELREALKGATAQQRLHIVETIGGTEAMKALGPLIDASAKELADLERQLQTQGSAASLTAALNKGLGGSLDALKSSADTAALEIGKTLAPAVDLAAKKLKGLVDAFASLPDGGKQAVVGIGGVAAAIPPLLVGAAVLIKSWKAVKDAFLATRAATGAAGAALRFLTGPIGLFIAGAATAALAWSQNWGSIRDITITVVDFLVTLIEEFAQGLGQTFTGLEDVMTGHVARGWEEIKAGTMRALNAIGAAATQAGERDAQRLQARLNKEQAIRDKALKAQAKANADAVKGGGAGPGIPGLGAREETEFERQRKAFAQAMAEASTRLKVALRGEGQELQNLAAQFPLVSAAQRENLFDTQKRTLTINDASDAEKKFREEIAKVNRSIRARRGDISEEERQIKDLMAANKGMTAEMARQLVVQTAVDREQERRNNLIQEAVKVHFLSRVMTEKDRLAIELFGNELLGTREKAIDFFNSLHDGVIEAHPAFSRLNKEQKKFTEEFLNIQGHPRVKAITDTIEDLEFDLLKARAPTEGLVTTFDLFKDQLKGVTDIGYALQLIGERGRNAAVDIQIIIDKLQKTEALKSLARSVQSTFEQAFSSLDQGFGSFFGSILDGFRNLLQQLAAEFLAAEVTKMLLNAFGGTKGRSLADTITSTLGAALGGKAKGKAMGGPVNANEPFLVGERGPEFFIPSRSGRIEPIAGGVTNNITINVSSPDVMGFRKSQAQIMADAARQAESFSRRNG